MYYQLTKHFNLCRLVLMMLSSVLLPACFNGSNSTGIASLQNGAINSNSTSSPTTLANSTLGGQSPVTGADITIKAADGSLLATTVSDSNARYQAKVPDQAYYPYIISTDTGIDLVTGAPPGFSLITAVTGPDSTIANINPFSTLIVKTAQAMPQGLTSSTLSLAGQLILQHLHFGLDTALVPDPITTPVTPQNLAALAKAGEILAEMIRRTHAALQVVGHDLSENDIVSAMAADMTDGFLDGNGAGGASALIAATANIVSGQVLIEGLSNNLNINGAWATDLLDNAIRAALPEITTTTADVAITAAMLQQTKTAIGAAQTIDPSETLSTLALTVNSLKPGMQLSAIEAVLPEKRGEDFNDAITLAVSASNSQWASINAAVRQTSQNPGNDKLLALAWYSSPGEVLGYIVYYGSTPESATTIASETSGTSVEYYTNADLGLNPGDSVCFRLKAFNLAGLSGFSGAACMYI